MQFIRELFTPSLKEIRGTITHAVRIFTEDPADPRVYDIQLDLDGFLYSDVVFTRDVQIPDDPTGMEVCIKLPTPEQEGYPIFLLMSRVPEVRFDQQQTIPVEQDVQAPQSTEQFEHGVVNAPPETEQAEVQLPFDPNTADQARQQ